MKLEPYPMARLSWALGSVLFVWACGGSDVPTGPTDEPIATGITISPTSLSYSSLGDTTRVSTQVVDQFGTELPGQTVSWTTSDTSVATVSVDGLVTAKGNGTAEIEATAGDAFASASVAVGQVAAALTVDPDSIVLNGPGDTLQAVGTVRDAGGSAIAGELISWVSDDDNVVTVGADGRLTAVATGSAVVTATSGSLSTQVPVSVTATPGSITASPDSIGFGSLGDTTIVSAVVRDEGGAVISGAAVSWRSVDPAVATVNGGRVVAVRNGSTLVIASAGAVADTVVVDVVQVPATISVAPDPIALNGPGDTLRAVGSVLDAGGSVIPGEAIAWSSTDPSIATVDGAGLVTAVAVGDANVTAMSGVLSSGVPVSVTQTPASVTLTPDSVLLTTIGDTIRIQAVVRDGTGAVISGASVTWTSSDSTVARVVGGLVTAQAFGSATITARAGSQTAMAKVIVQQPALGPSFSQVVNEIFVRRGCAASRCHGKGAGDLTLSATAAISYANLVNVRASAEPTLFRVLPNDATNSYLVIKLEGRQSSGGRMPIGGAPLSAADLANVKNWINAGAQNN